MATEIDRAGDESEPQNDRRNHVRQPEVGHRTQNQGRDGQKHRVNEHLADRLLHGNDRWHHRHPGGFVFIGVADRQGPKMRWSPQKDGDEQDKWLPGERILYRCPAHQDGNCSRRPANHDVLTTRALEPQRIDKDIEQGRRERQAGCQQVGPHPKNRKSDRFQG